METKVEGNTDYTGQWKTSLVSMAIKKSTRPAKLANDENQTIIWREQQQLPSRI